MPIKDTFDMLVKIFHCDGTQFVKNLADFQASIDMRVSSILGGHQQPIGLLGGLVQV